MSIEITILGCGHSGGVPLAGYEKPFWGDCDPHNPKNRRTRSSIYVKHADSGVLIDAGPDLRHHFLTHGMMELSSIIITHDHADHMHGLDDMRPVFFARDKKIFPVLADEETSKSILKSFGYLFCQKNESKHKAGSMNLYPKILDCEPLLPQWRWNGLECASFDQDHGYSISKGLRFGSVAYSTDFINLDNHAISCLQDLDLWIVDCLSITKKPTHCNLDLTLSWIEKVRPKKAVLTHMGLELDYERLRKMLPQHIEPAFDGMKISI